MYQLIQILWNIEIHGLVYSTVGKVGMKLKMAVGFNTAKVKSTKCISIHYLESHQ